MKFKTLAILALSAQSLFAKQIKPNIILIMADDVGVEAFKTYGGESYNTPHLNKLATQGLQFNHCYSQPLCTPSRVKLMTGQSNVCNYYDFSLLHPKLTTIGHFMQRAGYVTGITGKWQLYGAEHYKKTAQLGMHPDAAGFDSYRLWQIDKLGSRFDNPLVVENGKSLEGRGRYGPKMFNDFALDFIRENRNQPFFLYYPMVLVHNPFVPTPDSEKRGDMSRVKRRQANFSDMMSYMDQMVGNIITEVKKQGLEDNTLIIFTGDNGTHKTITSRWKGAPTKGGKGLSTDAGTHVPLYAYWPGKIKPNSRTDSLAEFSDFLPTVIEVAGAELKAEAKVTGRSLLPILMGDESFARESVYIYSNPRPTKNGFSYAVFARDQNYKLYSDGRFYHVTKDRLEKSNISTDSPHDKPDVRKRLQHKLDSMPKQGQMLIDGSESK